MAIINKKCFKCLPKREGVVNFTKEVMKFIFPGYFEEITGDIESYQNYLEAKILNNFSDVICDESKDKASEFVKSLENVANKLEKDLSFYLESDPACTSIDEVIITYPGFFATILHRISHELFKMNVYMVPRIISEYAHSKTGIDIHPGANISPNFFIDHGTGVVIGETVEIGEYVKIYHGVTLGAISLKNIEALKGVKRHPTIENNVTIYSNTCILGGNTIIGENSIIGSNVSIVKSVDKNSKIYQQKDRI